MDVVLLGGLWLPHEEWDEVVAALEEDGHRAVAVLLPGQGDGNSHATLDDQVTAVVLAVDECEGRPLVVGHSASSALAWIAADARPEKVGGVVLIGGFPVADGGTYADYFPVVDGVMPFPGWEPFAGPDSADLDEVTEDDWDRQVDVNLKAGFFLCRAAARAMRAQGRGDDRLNVVAAVAAKKAGLSRYAVLGKPRHSGGCARGVLQLRSIGGKALDPGCFAFLFQRFCGESVSHIHFCSGVFL